MTDVDHEWIDSLDEAALRTEAIAMLRVIDKLTDIIADSLGRRHVEVRVYTGTVTDTAPPLEAVPDE